MMYDSTSMLYQPDAMLRIQKLKEDFVKYVSIAVATALVGSYILAKLQYHFYRYALTDEGLKREFGIIYKRYTTIPYDRIQNVDIGRSLFSRILGLSDLHVQTAGASLGGAEITIPGLSKDTAFQLQAEVLERSKKSRLTTTI